MGCIFSAVKRKIIVIPNTSRILFLRVIPHVDFAGQSNNIFSSLLNHFNRNWFWSATVSVDISLTLIFDGLCFLDNIWLTGGGMAKHYITKALLSFNSKAFPARKGHRIGFSALSPCPHKVELHFILVLGEKQDLVRETLSSWWECVLIYGKIPNYVRYS